MWCVCVCGQKVTKKVIQPRTSCQILQSKMVALEEIGLSRCQGLRLEEDIFSPRGSPAVQVEWIWDHQQKIATFCEENEHLSVKLKPLAEADAASFRHHGHERRAKGSLLSFFSIPKVYY